VDAVWQFIGYLANSLLFLLVGVSLGETPLGAALPAVVWGIVGVILGRVALVYCFVPLHNIIARQLALRRDRRVPEGVAPARVPRLWRPLIVMSGLRGALSLALILSVPAVVPGLDGLRSIVYGVVFVTLVGQGIGLRILLPRWPHGKHEPA
jgi:CPA1 family monovalent cation:H+ antiporter